MSISHRSSEDLGGKIPKLNITIDKQADINISPNLKERINWAIQKPTKFLKIEGDTICSQKKRQK